MGPMGLDPARDAWVVIDDANVFVWPGFDLVPQVGGGFVRGAVTRAFFERIREAVLAFVPVVARADSTATEDRESLGSAESARSRAGRRPGRSE